MAGCVNARDWLEQRTGDAPPVLRDRVRQWAGDSTGEADNIAEGLAEAGRRALAHVVSDGTAGRQVALDLLAADALVTLALLAQAEQDPSRLAGFAEGLLRAGAGAP